MTMRVFVGGNELDPSEYSLTPVAGTPGAMVINMKGPIPAGSFTIEYDDGWKYGDLLDFSPYGVDSEVVMYVGHSRGALHRVVNLIDREEFDVLGTELATIEPPSMLARS